VGHDISIDAGHSFQGMPMFGLVSERRFVGAWNGLGYFSKRAARFDRS